MTDLLRDSLNLPGSGAWIDEPHRVLAFGVVYFAAQAAIDWFVASRPAAPEPAR